MIVTLPIPPSTNNLYFNLKSGGRAKSVRYKAWLKEAKDACESAFVAAGEPDWPTKQPMRLTVAIGVNYTRDITNCVKPIEDALCAFLPIPDDRYNNVVEISRTLDHAGFAKVELLPL